MTEPLQLLADTFQVSVHDLNSKTRSTETYPVAQGIQYTHMQFQQPAHWDIDNKGVVTYQPDNGADGYMQLSYFLAENELEHTPGKAKRKDKSGTLDIITIVFSRDYLAQFAASQTPKSNTDDILSFKQPVPFTTVIQLCHKTQQALNTIRDHPYAHSLRNMLIHAQVQMLLLFAMEDCALDTEEEHLVCTFLVNEVDREKIAKAKELLIQHIGNPITIKELSRKVAMNECYLKKGFKEIVGSTIFEFYQRKRMEYATMMLCEKGLNVTEVSGLLGYSSISHFSTAFKKHTGMKPCELLLR